MFKFPSNISSLSTIKILACVSSPLNDLIIFGTLNPNTINTNMIIVDIIKAFLFTISLIVNFITVNISLRVGFLISNFSTFIPSSITLFKSLCAVSSSDIFIM